MFSFANSWPSEMNRKRHSWRWEEGPIDPTQEHIELQYGDAASSSYDQWIPVALVSAPERQKFTVQFLISGMSPKEKKMLECAKQELNFFLIDKGEEDPWGYAQYHCTTASNVYSLMHWSFHPKDQKG